MPVSYTHLDVYKRQQLGFFIEKDIGRLTTEEYLLPLFFVVPGLLLLYYAFNLYTSKRIQGRRCV